MEKLVNVLKDRLNQNRLSRTVAAARDLETTKRVMPLFVVPKSLRDGVLVVEIDTPLHAYFFRQDIEAATERINAAIGRIVVTQIRLRVLHQDG